MENEIVQLIKKRNEMKEGKRVTNGRLTGRIMLPRFENEVIVLVQFENGRKLKEHSYVHCFHVCDLELMDEMENE